MQVLSNNPALTPHIQAAQHYQFVQKLMDTMPATQALKSFKALQKEIDIETSRIEKSSKVLSEEQLKDKFTNLWKPILNNFQAYSKFEQEAQAFGIDLRAEFELLASHPDFRSDNHFMERIAKRMNRTANKHEAVQEEEKKEVLFDEWKKAFPKAAQKHQALEQWFNAVLKENHDAPSYQEKVRLIWILSVTTIQPIYEEVNKMAVQTKTPDGKDFLFQFKECGAAKKKNFLKKAIPHWKLFVANPEQVFTILRSKDEPKVKQAKILEQLTETRAIFAAAGVEGKALDKLKAIVKKGAGKELKTRSSTNPPN